MKIQTLSGSFNVTVRVWDNPDAEIETHRWSMVRLQIDHTGYIEVDHGRPMNMQDPRYVAQRRHNLVLMDILQDEGLVEYRATSHEGDYEWFLTTEGERFFNAQMLAAIREGDWREWPVPEMMAEF